MMENDDFIKDNFLRNLVKKSSLEGPSDGFVEKVMERILPEQEFTPATRPFFYYLRTFLGYFLLAAVLTAFFWTSDIPVLSWLPGKQYLTDTVLPSFDFLYSWLRSSAGNGNGFPIPIMILVASVLFFLADRLIITYRNASRNHTSV